MDLEWIEEKVRDSEYKNITEFMLDVAWIQHNSSIVGTYYRFCFFFFFQFELVSSDR